MADAGGRILVVDDEEVIRTLVCTHLESRGFQCESAANGRHALELAGTCCFDLVLTDVQMPGLDGISLIRELQQNDPSLPVIVVTAQSSFDTAVRALRLGAYDYVLKPFPLEALDGAVNRAMERRRLVRENRHYQRLLELKVEEKTANLLRATSDVEEQTQRLKRALGRTQGSLLGTVTALAEAIEARGHETRNHCRRVREYAFLVGRRVGLGPRELRDLGWAALLHDVGLVGVPESVLTKQGELTATEWEAMRRHPALGRDILQGIPGLRRAAALVEAHHERFDGSGYPAARRGADVPLGARCLSVADALEALTSERPHRTALSMQKAIAEIHAEAGRAFDPAVVAALEKVPATELERVRREHPERETAEAALPL